MIRRISLISVILGVFASLSFGHYHFIQFNSRTAPWRGLPEKFDLSALPNKTLSYYVTDQTGVTLASNDTYIGLMSEIRSAAKVWNDVETSELRLVFGGFAAPNTPQSTPSLEIIFGDDIPPGLIALGGPQVLQTNFDSTSQFVPIQKSVVLIRPDLSTNPSFSERFFGTLVHEIGHGLGLQHTFTSGVMATRVTRSTGRSKPLTSDDIAGLSLLYPTSNFAQNTGSITGRVTQAGNGVNLASVVAVSPSGAAVSTLTNPDGTYRIDGLPPRAYYVYVHPLPPAQQGQATPGDIVFPRDSDGRSLGPGGPFQTIFYPGTNDPSQAFTVSPAAGATVQNVDFAVRGRTGFAINSVDTYAFPDAFAVKPAYLSPNIPHPFLVASGSGLFSGSSLAPGLSVTVLGGPTLSVRPYSPAPTSYVQIDFDPRTLSISPESPRHLVFSQNGDIYVLPAAFFHVEKLPPTISSVLATTDGSQRQAVINGTNLADGSQVYFDGVPATIRDSDIPGGRLTVIPPAAPPNHRASVVVLNPDGQSSLFVQGDTPSTYSYSSDLPGPSVSLSLPTLPAGTEAMLQIDSPAGAFVDGQTIVGFGTSDIQIRQLSVVSPTRLLVNIALNPTAQPGSVQLSVVSGLQLITQQFAFQIASPTRAFWLSSNIVNAQTGLPGISAGMQAVLTVGGTTAAANLNNATLTMDDRTVPITSVANNQITFQVPASASSGPSILKVEAAGERSWPILMLVSPPPPKAQTAATDKVETTPYQPAL